MSCPGSEGPPTGVREETVQCPGDVPQVKSDRGGPARPVPEFGRRQLARRLAQIRARLQQGVGGRHEERGHSLDGTAEPEFGVHTHSPVPTIRRHRSRFRRLKGDLDGTQRLGDELLGVPPSPPSNREANEYSPSIVPARNDPLPLPVA